MTPFTQLSLVLVLVASISLVLVKLKQPLLLGFILAGILLSAIGLPILTEAHTMDLLSQLGVAMLLFIIGLHLSPQSLKDLGSRVVIIGLTQVLLTTLLGTAIMFLFEFTLLQAFLLGLAISFSSTIVVLKILTDQKEERTLFGRVATGVLLVQDIIVCTLLIGVTSLTSVSGALPLQLLLILAKSVLLFGFLFLCTKFVLPKIYATAANHQELLFISSLAWGCGVAALFVVAGLSLEIGALAAGVALASSEYAPEISARLKPLRDFFLLLFFVLLGSTLHVSEIVQLFVPILIVTTFILLVKPLVLLSIMRRLKFHRQTSFKTGVSLSQVSEFSFILLAAWSANSLLPSSAVSIVTIAGVLSIAVSTFALPKLDYLYERFSPLLKRLPDEKPDVNHKTKPVEAIIFGYNSIGHMFVDSLKQLGLKVMVVDFDPEQIELLQKKKITHRYGDAADIEFLATLPLSDVKIVISSIPQLETNQVILKYVNQEIPDILSIVFADVDKHQSQLYQAGATYVVYPHYHAADHITTLLSRFGLNSKRFQRLSSQAGY